MPLHSACIERANELIGVLGTTVSLIKSLGSLPIAGPALSLLGFILEVIREERVDAESLHSAALKLVKVMKRTTQAVHMALCQEHEDYTRELIELLTVIEDCARHLEHYECKSSSRKIFDSIVNWKPGPAAILQLIECCEDRLSNLEIHHIAEVVEDNATSEK